MRSVTIGKVASATGVKVTTIRYYESIGLLPEPDRSDSGQRQYGTGAIERLKFIRHARELGFDIPAIRDLLALQDDTDGGCDKVDAIARDTLSKVKSRLARLMALQTELERMIEYCPGTSVRSCKILQVLSDHSLCADDVHDGTLRHDDIKFANL